MLDTFAAAFLVFAFTALALFELAIALGAPLGEYSFGGQNKGVLPTHWRVVAFVFVFVALGIAGHYLAQTGAVSPLLGSTGNTFVNWFLVGFTALSALGITSLDLRKKSGSGAARLSPCCSRPSSWPSRVPSYLVHPRI